MMYGQDTASASVLCSVHHGSQTCRSRCRFRSHCVLLLHSCWQSRAMSRVYFTLWSAYVVRFFNFVGTHYLKLYFLAGHRLYVSRWASPLHNRRIHRVRAAFRPFARLRFRGVFFTRLLPILVPPENFLYVVFSTRATLEILVIPFTCLCF